MARQTITEALVRKAEPGFLRDDKLVGFALRTTEAGAKAYIVEGRVGGRTRRFTIAPAERMTVAEARDAARRLLAGMSEGKDPQVARRAGRERSATLEAQLDEYLQAKQVKPSTAAKYRAVMRRCAGDWLSTPLAEITPAMARLRYEELTRRSPAEANNCMRVLRAVSRRAVVVLPDKADGSPSMKCVATDSLRGSWKTLPRRASVLEPSELPAWWKAVDDLRSADSSRALQCLLLTGLRLNEVLQLDWRDIDEKRRRLTIADSKTGAFVKIIGPKLAGLLAKWREEHGRGAICPLKDLRAALDSVEKRGGKLIMPHDLRRTFASFAERAGVPYITLKVLLNHATAADVTAGYVRPGETDLLHWSAVVETAIFSAAEGEPANVVPRKRGAK